MKKRTISILLAGAMTMAAVMGSTVTAFAGEEDTLEFYHGYYHDESEWPAAKVMRDIYDEFAKTHADGEVKFEPIAVENRDEIVSAEVAGGNFPDMVDCGLPLSLAAISQGLVLDLKPYIDENNLQDAVGLNYTQNDVDGHIYTVHDQLESRGLWYNTEVFEQAGITAEEAFKDWESFGAAMDKVHELGGDTYGYAAGQGSRYIINAVLASTEEGRELLKGELTPEGIESEAFAEAFKTAAKLDQANGSDHTTEDVGNLMDDFNKNGKAAVLFNGVWNVSGIDAGLADKIESQIFPGNVSVVTAGSGHSISANLSEAETELALEFLAYMVSPEVQAKIFTGVQANPCNTTLDLKALAEESGDPITQKLAEACTQVNSAETVVTDLNYVWGSDVGSAIINALMESAVEGTDIDARFEQLKQELTALVA